MHVQAADGAEQTLQADRVLVAVAAGRVSEAESLPLDRNGRALWIDDECRTSMRNVWAIGDVAGEPMLAHCAMAQGEMVAELIAGKRRKFVPASIPAVASPIRRSSRPAGRRTTRGRPMSTA